MFVAAMARNSVPLGELSELARNASKRAGCPGYANIDPARYSCGIITLARLERSLVRLHLPRGASHV
ncbi:hypothetical protein JTE90_027229 [Oedothorax gibbosus]|uniref:Uncharacterized protein n=1 Tax=Oedothorax gibbosus TaxID=931172 RepID=A0AAV6U2U8_9ARAC|nr:hypothetical protein JTE90_027229 [Oedothorax gibbosus]